jgi:hypothetical protein
MTFGQAPKAAFFFRFGFTAEHPAILRDALVEHARHNPVTSTVKTPFGTTYEVDGRLASPDGRNPWVLVVGFVRDGEANARLATAFPSKGPSL